jgi:hypothetical protein
MFNKQKQVHNDILITNDTYIVVIYAYDVNNSYSSIVWSTDIISLLSRVDAVPRDL